MAENTIVPGETTTIGGGNGDGGGVQPFVWAIVAVIAVAAIAVTVELIIMFVLKRKKNKQNVESRTVSHENHLARYNEVVARSVSQMTEAPASFTPSPDPLQPQVRRYDEFTLVVENAFREEAVTSENNVIQAYENAAYEHTEIPAVAPDSNQQDDGVSSGYVSSIATMERHSPESPRNEDSADSGATREHQDTDKPGDIHQYADQLAFNVMDDAQDIIEIKLADDDSEAGSVKADANENKYVSSVAISGGGDQNRDPPDLVDVDSYVDKMFTFDNVLGNIKDPVSSSNDKGQEAVKASEIEVVQNDELTTL